MQWSQTYTAQQLLESRVVDHWKAMSKRFNRQQRANQERIKKERGKSKEWRQHRRRSNNFHRTTTTDGRTNADLFPDWLAG